VSAFTKINLAKLPAAVVIQEVDFEAVLADLKADFIDRYEDADDVIDLESAPVVKLLEVAAYRETILLNRINQAAKAVMLATAEDEDLDNLAAIVPMSRLDGEGNDAFRARIQLAPESFSTAGPRGGYEFHAKSVSADITDVYVDEPAPGSVDVYILSSAAAVPAALLTAVNAALSDDEIRPLTDNVTVKSFVSVDYDIDAQLVMAEGPDSATVLAAAQTSLQAYLHDRRSFGRDVTLAGLLSALVVEGVENVNLVSPDADVLVDPNEVALASSVSVLDAANV